MAIVPATANWQDEAYADIHARGYGGDIRVPLLMVGFFTKIHLVMGTQRSLPSISIMSRRSGSMVIAITGSIGKEATVFYRRLADLVSRKSNVIL